MTQTPSFNKRYRFRGCIIVKAAIPIIEIDAIKTSLFNSSPEIGIANIKSQSLYTRKV